MRQREIMDEKDRDIIMSQNLRREEREGEREKMGYYMHERARMLIKMVGELK